MDRRCAEPHRPGDPGEPHFESDISGLIGHRRFAATDWQGRIVHRRRRGEVDRPPPHAVDVFVDWFGSAFTAEAPATHFDRVAGSPPPWSPGEIVP